MVNILYPHLKYISRNRKNCQPTYWGPLKKAMCLQTTKRFVEMETFEKELSGKKVEILKFQKEKKNGLFQKKTVQKPYLL